jgi:hypothetical protein
MSANDMPPVRRLELNGGSLQNPPLLEKEPLHASGSPECGCGQLDRLAV